MVNLAIKELLMIPGPTMVPLDILLAQAGQMINHRGPSFKQIQDKIVTKGRDLFKTKNGSVFILTCSGTGGMEAAVVNTINPGEQVLVLKVGEFGERFVKICKAFGAVVDVLSVEPGQALQPTAVAKQLANYAPGNLKAVLFQQNETSTGVLNPVKEIAALIRKQSPDTLVIVDSVSGLLTADLQMDAWDLDVVCAGSQKAFMTAPGVALLAVSSRAMKAIEACKNPRFYFDLVAAKKFLETGETPWTPAISVIYGMDKAYDLIFQEGVENIFKRHELLMKATRAGVRATGCKLLVTDERVASRAVTAILPPEGVDAEALRKEVKNKWGVVFAAGQGALKGKIFRITHLGYTDPKDTFAALACLEMALRSLGSPVELGKGVAAAQEAFMQVEPVVA